MKNHIQHKNAFSMLELIFVIIILGIVSSIGAEIISRTYEGYIIQRAQHRASVKTELVATQIANRLSHAIPGTVVRRRLLVAPSVVEDINVPTAVNHNILQWVAADADGFNSISAAPPGWSGFADVDASPVAGIIISTPGSNLPLAQTIATNLNGGAVNPIPNASVYYRANNALQQRGIANVAANTITTDLALGSISEHYKLAWTSYAIEAQAGGNLVLHYNFLPLRGTDIANDQNELLLRNVTTFRFRGDGQTIRFKICVSEDIGFAGAANMVTICKEKAVF